MATPASVLSIIDAFAVFLFKTFFPPQVHIPSALAYRTRAAISVKSVSFLFMAHHTFFYTEIGSHTHVHTHAHNVPNLKSSTRRTNMKTFSATKRIFLSWCEAILCIFHIALVLQLASCILHLLHRFNSQHILLLVCGSTLAQAAPNAWKCSSFLTKPQSGIRHPAHPDILCTTRCTNA